MFAVLNLPSFSVQAALRHEPELRSRPVALSDPEQSKSHIFQLNSRAREHGVAAGQTANQAMARCKELVIRTRSRSQEQIATELFLQAAYAFSPNIEATATGICTIDLKGLGLRATDVTEWALNVKAALAQFWLDAVVGIAPTPGLALLAARMADPVLHVQNAGEFTARLPIEILQPPPEVFDLLARWGIGTVGEFLALGKDNVAERLGRPALELFDCVSASIRPLKLVPPPVEFVEQMEFEHEIETAEPLFFVLRRFVEQISRRLGMTHRVVAELQLRLGLSSGAACERTFKLPSPTGDIEVLFRMLHTDLDDLRTNSPIVSLRLEAKAARPETRQLGLFETSLRNPDQFSETLARLSALCGADRVGFPVVEATHRPDAFRMERPDFNRIPAVIPQKEHPPGLQLRRFRPGIHAIVEFRRQEPALINSPVCRGIISDFRGPFAGSGGWWDASRWAREEWDIQIADGGLYRVVLSEEGCFVEGVYD